MAVDAGSIYSSVRIRLDSLDGDIKGVYARLDALESQITQKMDKPTKAVTASFNGMSLAGIAAFVGINKAIKSVVGTYASFEQSMANVASVAGASTAEFDQLTSAAEKAGETTRYSASQAADALYALASAGFNATQATQSLSGVLSLAQATGSDLGSTAESMASTISQYGLAATDAARVSNVFAAAAATSQANMEKLTTGLRQVGPVAGSLGISLEETVANLDALYNKGFQGEQAGTALRSILLDLADSSSTVVQSLEKQGLTYDQINPKTVGLSKAMENIAASGADLTTTFGKVSAAEAIALVQTAKDGTKNLEDMQKQITGTDYAARSAATMNDTLKGTIDELSSEAEATAIKFGKEFTPALRELAEGAKKVVGWIGQLPTPLLAVVGSAAAVITGITGITSALSIMGITISATAPVLAGIGLALTAIVTAGTLVAKHFADQQHVTEQLNKATEDLKNTSDEYKKTQDELATKADKLTKAEKEVLENRKKLLALDMQKKLLEMSESYNKVNKQIEIFNNKTKYSQETIDKYNSGLASLKARLAAQGATQEEVDKAIDRYNKLNSKDYNSAIKTNIANSELLTKAQTDLQGSINDVAVAVSNGSVNIDYLKNTNTGLYNAIMQQVSALSTQKEKISDVTDSVSNEWKKAIKKALGLDPKTFSTGAQAVKIYTENIKSSLSSAVDSAKSSGKSVADVYTSYANKVQSAIEKLLQSGSYTEDEATIKSLEKLRDEFKQGINASSFDDEITKLNNMIVAAKEGADAVERLNVKMQHQDWSTEQIDEYIAKTKELKNATDSMGISMEEWQGYAQNAITGTIASFESLGEAVATGKGLWQAFAASALSAIGSVLEGIGAELAITAAKQFVAASVSASNIYTAWMAPGQIASGTKAAAESAVAYTTAGLIKGLASKVSNMATGGIVEPTSGGTITRQAENGYGEVDYNVGPTGRAHTQQMGSAIAQELVNLGVVGSSGGQTINLVLDGKQITRVITRRQKNKDY